MPKQPMKTKAEPGTTKRRLFNRVHPAVPRSSDTCFLPLAAGCAFSTFHQYFCTVPIVVLVEPAVSLVGRPHQAERPWRWQLQRYTVRFGRIQRSYCSIVVLVKVIEGGRTLCPAERPRRGTAPGSITPPPRMPDPLRWVPGCQLGGARS